MLFKITFFITLSFLQPFQILTEPTGDNVCSFAKSGKCPTTLIFPSKYSCQNDSECNGLRRCCPFSSGKSFCSDPEKSSMLLSCDPNATASAGEVPCNSDVDCLDSLGIQKCCVDKSKCRTYCMQGIDPNTDPNICFSIKKKPSEDYCPKPLVNPGNVDCSVSDECPGNQICCLSKPGGPRRCSDPYSEKARNCPSLNELERGTPCSNDDDCPNSNTCCPVNPCQYFCTLTTTSTKIPTDIPTTPPSVPVTSPTGSTSSRPTLPWPFPNVPVCPPLFPNALAKKGTCPPSDTVRNKGGFCFFDSNCARQLKCCGGQKCKFYACAQPIY